VKIEIEIPEAVLDAIAAKVAAQIKPTLMRPPESRAQAEELMSVCQLAAHLGVSKDGIYRKTAGNEIPFVKVGRLVKFRRSEIDAWLSTRSVPDISSLSAPPPPGGRRIGIPVVPQNHSRRRPLTGAVK
jgi:excisionase family DNA binding protein